MEKTSKPLPLQLLRAFLSRAVESALDDQARSRALATTLEKHVIQLRWKHGGKSLITVSAPVKVKVPVKVMVCFACSIEYPMGSTLCTCGKRLEPLVVGLE